MEDLKIAVNKDNPQIPSHLTEEVWLINRFMKIEQVLDLIDKYDVSWQVRQQGYFNQRKSNFISRFRCA